MKESFSTSEVAKYCHVSADTIRKWAEAGRIQVLKTPGGHRRIRRDSLVQFLETNGIPLHPDLCAKGVRILIVEADTRVAAVIRRFLERGIGSFQLDAADTSFEAGYKVAAGSPDVLFLATDFPDMDAVAVCRWLKASSAHARTQVMVIAKPEDGRLAAQAMEQGASGYLEKPFTPDDLRRALARIGVEPR
jgi:two-component system, OmpR family, response regulator RpaA